MVPRSQHGLAASCCPLLHIQVEFPLGLAQWRLAFFHLRQDSRKLGVFGLLNIKNVLEEPTILRVLVVSPINFVDVHHVHPQIVELEGQALLARLHLLLVEVADLCEWAQELSWRQAGVLAEELSQLCASKDSAGRRIFLGEPAPEPPLSGFSVSGCLILHFGLSGIYIRCKYFIKIYI